MSEDLRQHLLDSMRRDLSKMVAHGWLTEDAQDRVRAELTGNATHAYPPPQQHAARGSTGYPPNTSVGYPPAAQQTYAPEQRKSAAYPPDQKKAAVPTPAPKKQDKKAPAPPLFSAKALWDFQGEDDGDLSFAKGTAKQQRAPLL